jgi:hypothetical protein
MDLQSTKNLKKSERGRSEPKLSIVIFRTVTSVTAVSPRASLLQFRICARAVSRLSPTAQAHPVPSAQAQTLSVLPLPNSSQPSARNMLNSLRAST